MKITRQDLRQMIIQEFRKYKGGKHNPCWPGHSPGGGKRGEPKTKVGKSGKRVANCKKIKENEFEEQTLVDFQRDPQKFGMTPADSLKVFSEPDLYRMQQVREGDPKVGTGKKPKRSGRRLYTDENPKDTVSVKFRTASDIRKTLSKKSFKSKSHKRQSQIINLIHQRARAAYKNAKDPKVKKRLKRAYDYASDRKEASKRKTKRMQSKK